jgi:hypothetical protein
MRMVGAWHFLRVHSESAIAPRRFLVIGAEAGQKLSGFHICQKGSGQGGGCNINLIAAQCRQDRTVVLIGRGFPFHAKARKQKTRTGRMQIINRRQQPWHATGFKDHAVKSLVGLFPGINVSRVLASAIMGLGDVENLGRQIRGGMAQGQNFKRCAHFGNFADFGNIKTGNPDTAAGLTDSKALRLQPAKSLTHRDVAGTEFSGEMILTEFHARGEFARNDPLRQRPRDPAGDGGVLNGFCHIL